jgi:hypothetical protein
VTRLSSVLPCLPVPIWLHASGGGSCSLRLCPGIFAPVIASGALRAAKQSSEPSLVALDCFGPELAVGPRYAWTRWGLATTAQASRQGPIQVIPGQALRASVLLPASRL